MSLTSTIIISSYPYQYKIDYDRLEKEFQIETVEPRTVEPRTVEETDDFKTSSEVVDFMIENLKSWFVATLITYKSNCRHGDVAKGSIAKNQTFTSPSENGFKEFIELLQTKQYRDTAYDGYSDCDDFSDEEDDDDEDDNEDEEDNDTASQEDEENEETEEDNEDDKDEDEDDDTASQEDNEDDDEDSYISNNESKYTKDDIYEQEEFDNIDYNLVVYFNNNVYDKMKRSDCCPKNDSNEIELGDDDSYRLYYYVYNKSKNCLLLSDGMPALYLEHSLLLDFLEEEFGSPFKCIDLGNKKVYERKDKVTVESKYIESKNDNNNQYELTIHKNKLYTHNDYIHIEDGYTDFDVKISISKSYPFYILSINSEIQLLEITVTGSMYHYTCGSYNTEMEELNIAFTHNCKSSNEFKEVLNYLKNNETIIKQQFDNTDLEGYTETIIERIEKKFPEFDDIIYKMVVVNKNIPDNFDSKCDITFDFDLNIYNNKKLLLSVKLIGILEYYTGDETYCQDSNCKLLYKCDDNKIINKAIKYLENNYTSLNNQISNYIIEEFMDDFVCELYSLINNSDSDSYSDSEY